MSKSLRDEARESVRNIFELNIQKMKKSDGEEKNAAQKMADYILEKNINTQLSHLSEKRTAPVKKWWKEKCIKDERFYFLEDLNEILKDSDELSNRDKKILRSAQMKTKSGFFAKLMNIFR